ncbi:MAG: DedA family protein [Chloroflexota bacterium]
MPQATTLIAQYGFAVVALIIFIGEIGIPILLPGEIALLLVGSQLVHSGTQLVLVCTAFAATDVLATTILYSVARTGGTRLIHVVERRLFHGGKGPEEFLAAWHSKLAGSDALAILVIRAIPGIRISAPVAAGVMHVRTRHFLLGAIPGSIVWTGIPLALGYELRRHIDTLLAISNRVLTGIIIVVAAVVLIAGGRWWIRRKRADGTARSNEDPETPSWNNTELPHGTG